MFLHSAATSFTRPFGPPSPLGSRGKRPPSPLRAFALKRNLAQAGDGVRRPGEGLALRYRPHLSIQKVGQKEVQTGSIEGAGALRQRAMRNGKGGATGRNRRRTLKRLNWQKF